MDVMVHVGVVVGRRSVGSVESPWDEHVVVYLLGVPNCCINISVYLLSIQVKYPGHYPKMVLNIRRANI